MNIYTRYGACSFAPFEFVKFARRNSSYFIEYLEIIIDRKGRIHLAVPSHSCKLVELAINEYGFDDKDVAINYCLSDYIISKYGYVAVWYDRIVYSGYAPQPCSYWKHMFTPDEYNNVLNTIPGINKLQKRTLSILSKASMLDPKYTEVIATEYQLSLFHEYFLHT